MKKNNKFFIITIDTEGDNQWDNDKGISTENVKFLPRFQELAEKYSFKPVWLTNYEMANDDEFVKYFKEKQDNGLCEIGMHLHAWNNPPEYKLEKKTNERSYLIEYPNGIMEQKIKTLTDLLFEKFGKKPVSHRSGRWALNDTYLNLLEKYGYNIDCSVTPHVNWYKSKGITGIGGSDYTNYSEKPYYVRNNILEVPMTIRKSHSFQKERVTNLKRFLREIELFLFGRKQWIRPDRDLSLKGIKKVIKQCNDNNEYVMFMIHSSELMPGGSPNFTDEESIEKLYCVIESIFKYAKEKNYVGVTLREFYNNYGK